MIWAPSRRAPSGPVKCRSNGVGVGPEQLGEHRRGRLALGVAVLGRLDDLGVDAERHVVDEDPAADLGQVDAAARPRRRTRRARRRRRRGRGRGRGRSGSGCRPGCRRAGRPARMATEATSAWEPSPPAMPITSAPRSMASWASSSRSSPGWSTTGSMPRGPALVDQAEPLGLPAAGLQVHDQHAAGGPGRRACPGVSQRLQRARRPRRSA